MMKSQTLKHFILPITLLLFCACEEDKNPIVTLEEDKKSNFRIEYQHSGDTGDFTKSLEVGDNFVFEDSQLEAPTTLLDKDLVKNDYGFTSTEPMSSIEVAVTSVIIPFRGDDIEMKVRLVIFRDDQKIDEQEFTTTAADVSSVHRLKYEAE